MTHPAPPPALTQKLRRLTTLALSPRARFGYVALLLAASTMTAIVTALLVTEVDLPTRTVTALAIMIAIGLSWIGFAGWVLTHKRILLGRQRVIAGRLAVAFCAVFVAGAALVGAATSGPAAVAATGLGVVMLLVALGLWWRASSVFRQLSARREALERQLKP